MTATNKNGPAVLRPDDLTAHARGGGASTIPLVGRGVGSTSLLNGITSFEPGATIALHSHNCEESVMVIEGDAVAEIDGVDYPLKTFDTTWIPANLPHRFRNASDTKRMRIFWTYASISATRTLVATGETRSIDDEQAARAAQAAEG
jgi:putative monooxygenase